MLTIMTSGCAYSIKVNDMRPLVKTSKTSPVRTAFGVIAAFVISVMAIACEKNPDTDGQEKDTPDEKEETVFQIVSGKSVETGVFASGFSVTVKRNTDCDVTTDSDWIHLSGSRATVSDIMDFNVDFNGTRKERRGEISFISKSGGEKQIVEVRQRGGVWIDCSLSPTSGKNTWSTTDTIGVYGQGFLNQPFVHHEGNWFVADHHGKLESVSAYYPYRRGHASEICGDEILAYLIADDSFNFEPAARLLTVNVTSGSGKDCRVISDSKIFGPWEFSEGRIKASSSEAEVMINSGTCAIPVKASVKEDIGVIVSHPDNRVSADSHAIEMDGDKNVEHKDAKRYGALDTDENANCYIIDKAGDYCFKLRDAAGGQRWTGSGCSMEVIWSDFAKDFVNEPAIIGDMVFFNAKMSKEKQGNAGLALKDANGKILWSWHLWLTDQTDFRSVEKGKLLNIPLGSVTDSRDFQYGEHYHALIYQYGRKDPFPNQSPESDFLAITDEGLDAFGNTGGFGVFYRRDFHEGVFDESCPMVAVESDNGKFGESSNIKWNVKDWDEVNNPCPPGFSIPDGKVVWKYMTGLDGRYAAWPGLKVKDLAAVRFHNNGLLNIEENYWFPAVKDRTPLYGVENQYHPYCGIPSSSFYTWIRRTETNAGGYHTANSVHWTPDDMYGIEIDSWAYGHYMPLVCVKD